METRVCTKCGEEKPATKEFFYKEKRGHLGLRAQCKVCHKAFSKRYNEQNPEEIAERKKRYYERKKEEILAQHKRYYEKNKEARDEYRKRYRENQPAAIYQIKNKETGKTYIGATTMFPSRRTGHKTALRTGKHENQALQEDYNKYGLDVFEFEVIEEHPCDTDFKILEKIEKETIKRLLSEGKELYNTVLYSTR